MRLPQFLTGVPESASTTRMVELKDPPIDRGTPLDDLGKSTFHDSGNHGVRALVANRLCDRQGMDNVTK